MQSTAKKIKSEENALSMPIKTEINVEPKLDQDIEKVASETDKENNNGNSNTKELKSVKIDEEIPFPLNFSITKVKRHIFADEPRITHIQIR